MNTFIKKFFPIERTIAQEKGDFKLFALFERENVPGIWDVVLAADWLPSEEMKSLRYVFGKIRAVLDKYLKVSKVVLLNSNEPFVKALQDFLEDYHNPNVFSGVQSFSFGLHVSTLDFVRSPRFILDVYESGVQDLSWTSSKCLREIRATGATSLLSNKTPTKSINIRRDRGPYSHLKPFKILYGPQTGPNNLIK